MRRSDCLAVGLAALRVLLVLPGLFVSTGLSRAEDLRSPEAEPPPILERIGLQRRLLAFAVRPDGRAAAYVCVGETCTLPLTTPEALQEALLGARQQKRS